MDGILQNTRTTLAARRLLPHLLTPGSPGCTFSTPNEMADALRASQHRSGCHDSRLFSTTVSHKKVQI